ncbi:MAG: histidinol dehydrogenase, partial [Candidatus Nephrothrix sp. EaCA]
KNIEKFHAAQKQTFAAVETVPGVCCSRRATPIEKVGLYIPGGSAPLFSTVLMLGIPAKLAGCREIILCSPPSSSGAVNPAILYAASSVGIAKIFKAGGAQAIAAMAFGTETIPQVYKIFGPGNQYVTKAKQLVNQQGIAIDIPAGPSEVLVFADEQANPVFVAADLLSQAEHGADSQVMLVCAEEKTAEKISRETASQLKELPRRQIAEEAMKNSCAVVFNLKEDCIDFINEYAAEHLIINTRDCDEIAEKITNAGSVFLGAYTPEAAGDYASGANHTLPTAGFAKACSGVSLDSFMKFTTVQKISREGLKNLAPAIVAMAKAEALHGHAKAIEVRLSIHE